MSGTIETCLFFVFQCNCKIKSVFNAKTSANYNNAMFEKYFF